MNDVQKTVVTLIKSALTGESYTLQKENLQEAFKYSIKHNVANMAYYGAVNCGVPTSSTEMLSLFPYVCKRMAHSEKQMRELKQLFNAFDENGIEYMPLKGTLLKEIYPKCDMRTMSDADILIRVEQYEKIEKIVAGLGYAFVKDNVNELVWNKKEMLIELHRYLVAPSHQDLFKVLGNGWKCANLCKDSKTRYQMNEEDFYFYLFIHFAKHYRSGGIGVRQAVDLWVYRNKTSNLDLELVKSKLEALKMLEFYNNICDMLDVWFGNKESTDKTDFLTSYIFASGNFGTQENREMANVVRESKSSGSVKKSFFKKIITTVFLPYKRMVQLYKILKKAPYLLPFLWVWRLFKGLFFKHRSIKEFNIDSTALKKVENFNKDLEYVGANFEFIEE